MNQTTLVLVAVLVASALITGTIATIQPAAAHKAHYKQSNSVSLEQEIKAAQCINTTISNCNNNYQQAANIAVIDHTHQEN
jgi:hypothetical protein